MIHQNKPNFRKQLTSQGSNNPYLPSRQITTYSRKSNDATIDLDSD